MTPKLKIQPSYCSERFTMKRQRLKSVAFRSLRQTMIAQSDDEETAAEPAFGAGDTAIMG